MSPLQSWTVCAVLGGAWAGCTRAPHPTPKLLPSAVANAPRAKPVPRITGPKGALFGRITDSATEKGVPGAVVILRPFFPGPSRFARTDAEGRYRIPLLLPGDYRLSVRARGYWSIKGGVVWVTPGRTAKFPIEVTSVRTTLRSRKATFLRPGMPKPVRIAGSHPRYLEEAKARNITGIVVLLFKIQLDGTVADIRLIRGLPILGEECVRAVRGWRFKPYRHQGRRLTLIVSQPFRFVLHD